LALHTLQLGGIDMDELPRFTLDEVADLSVNPNWADLNADANIALVVDLEQGTGTCPDRALAGWLGAQPIPTIGFGEAVPEGLEDVFDLTIDQPEELNLLAERIGRNPIASAVTVQVLRTSMRLSTSRALEVESLGYATLQAGAEYANWLRASEFRTQSKGTDTPVRMARHGSDVSIALSDPDSANALGVAMRDALSEAFQAVGADASIESVIVTGDGAHFCAGGDLTEFKRAQDTALSHRIRCLRMPARYLAAAAHKYTFKVHGACIGAGIELAAFADHISAHPDTYFRLPEVAMGLLPGAGGCVSIPRRIGRQQAARIMILGQDISAAEALSLGLIDAIE
ncbi:MAG: enoyl-CoA hydratase/isomerase family protein, partial [Gammaproteobacteria bacterium]|nr:enoyl-CoA hydratase/isomerase family protein [Gammaproteobacteria bacterium]